MNIGGEPSEEDLAKSKENFAKFNAQVAKSLADRGNPTYFAGDRLTIADFVLANHYLSYAFNETNEKDIVATAKATVAETPNVGEYMERVKAQIAGYLEVRGKYMI